MKAAIARATMSLATCCLEESRPEWALAMRGEFAAAAEDGTSLSFAAGCLIAALREMPALARGRFALANYVFALGLLIPMAVLQLQCVAGLRYFSFARGGLYSLLTLGSSQEPYLAHAYSSALPLLLTLWIVLGIGHLRLAWVLLERDWPKVVRIGALTGAASATLVIFTVVLFVDDVGVALQAVLVAVELTGIYALARWHADLFRNGRSEVVAG